MPINPNTNVGLFVLEKFEGDPHKFLSEVLSRPHPRCKRFGSKVIKKFGNYYFQRMTKDEKERWLRENTGVVYDVKSERDALDFAVMLKQTTTLCESLGSYHWYYFPNFSETESVLMANAHHSFCDGLTWS